MESDEDEPDEQVQVTPMGRGAWVRKKTKFFDHSHSGERGQFHSAGINCAGPGSEIDGARLGQQYEGAGYNVNQGVIAM